MVYLKKTRIAPTESALRKRASIKGYRLVKSRCRVPESRSFGGYMIVEADLNIGVDGVAPWDFSLDLGEAAESIEALPNLRN